MNRQLRMTSDQYDDLRAHLFPGDGKEAAAVALCGRHAHGQRTHLLVQKVFPVPYQHCSQRTPEALQWKTDVLVPVLQEAMIKGGSILKIHSHPNDVSVFSTIDDVADRDLFSSVAGWLGDDVVNASAIMLQDGTIRARLVTGSVEFIPFDRVAVVGDDVKLYDQKTGPNKREFTQRHAQLFGDATAGLLGRLRVGIVGASGTGSVVAELLNRLGVNEIVLVDPDRIEEKNLNRILNSLRSDIGRHKTDCLKDAIERIGLGTKVMSVPLNLHSTSAVRKIASCDFVFGCVDGAEGRNLINRIATFYLVPYVDVGVRLDADGRGGIEQVCGQIHYLRPGGSSLMSRHAITPEQVRAESTRRTDPERYEADQKQGYIKGINVERPAVISINTFFASQAVNEFLARLHPYRHDPNAEFAHYSVSLAQMLLYRLGDDGKSDAGLARHLGRGDIEPLLGMPSLSSEK